MLLESGSLPSSTTSVAIGACRQNKLCTWRITLHHDCICSCTQKMAAFPRCCHVRRRGRLCPRRSDEAGVRDAAHHWFRSHVYTSTVVELVSYLRRAITWNIESARECASFAASVLAPGIRLSCVFDSVCLRRLIQFACAFYV